MVLLQDIAGSRNGARLAPVIGSLRLRKLPERHDLKRPGQLHGKREHARRITGSDETLVSARNVLMEHLRNRAKRLIWGEFRGGGDRDRRLIGPWRAPGGFSEGLMFDEASTPYAISDKIREPYYGLVSVML